jgi:hypothetical protein
MTSDPANLLTISCTTNQALCQCGTGGPCDAAADQRWYGCKSNADCPSNMVCSAYKNFFGNYGVVYTACFVPGTWPGGDNQFNGNTVCDSTKPSNPQCPTGNQCYGGDEVGYCAP